MSRMTRIGDNDSGHDACPPRGLGEGSENVFVNNKSAGRVGDTYPAHGCPIHLPHTGVISSGSRTVFINGKSAGRVGDSVSCGGNVAQGSENVFAGD